MFDGNNSSAMADFVSRTTISKQTISYVVAAVLCVYALVYKIPMPCFGCEKGGFWYRCVMDTGEGTSSCSAYRQAKSRVETGARIMDEAGVYLDHIWDFTKTELPSVIEDFLATLKDQILGLKDSMKAKIEQIIAFLRDKVTLFVSKIKDAAVSTYENFMEKVINPLIQFFIANLLQPVVTLFEKIVEFRNLVWRTLDKAIDSFANIGIGEFVGDVVDVFQKIPEAMDKIRPMLVKLINTIKNKTIGTVNTGIRKSIQGIETSVNSMSAGIDDGVNLAVRGLNTVKNTLVKNLNTQINKMGDGIETVVNSTTGAIEKSVNTSVKGVTDGINKSMDKVEGGINKVIDATDEVVEGAEVALNTVGCKINTAMNGVEKGVNGIAGGVENAIKVLVSPINSISGALRKIRDTKIGWSKRYDFKVKKVTIGFSGLQPFKSLPAPKNVSSPKLEKLDIPGVPTTTFGRVNARVDIPSINFKGVDIPSVKIPEVDIEAPKDIKNINIPDIEIPQAEIPVPADVKEEDIEFPTIPGMGFIGDKVAEIKKSIRSIFETAMAPLYDGVATLMALVSSVISSAVHFFQNYLTWTAIKERFSVLTSMAAKGLQKMKSWFVDEIVPGFVSLIKSMADPILAFVKTVSEQTWKYMKKMGQSVAHVFNDAFRVITRVTGMVAKGVLYTGLFMVGTTIDKYTMWLPLPLSVKMLLLLASILWMMFGGVLRNMKVIVDLVLLVLKGMVQGITDLDAEIDARFLGKQVDSAVASSFLI